MRTQTKKRTWNDEDGSEFDKADLGENRVRICRVALVIYCFNRYEFPMYQYNCFESRY